MKKLVLLALTALALASCQQAPGDTSPPPVTVSARPPIRLNVAQVTVAENRPIGGPSIEASMPTPPIVAIKKWVGERFIAAGAQGTFEITVDDASVKETKLPKKTGLTGFFTDDQDARYDGHIHITMRLYDGVNTISAAEGDVDVTRMHTIDEKATVAQRETMLNGLVQDMMLQLDSEAEKRLRQYFGKFIL